MGSWRRCARFEAFEDYWGEPVDFDARWEVVPDNSVGLLGMEAGDFDVIEPTPQFAAEMEGNENICIEESGFLLEPLHLSFNLNIPVDKMPPEDTVPSDFFQDVRVRQAFNYAFDYEAYIAAGLEGFGQTSNPLFRPICWGHRSGRAQVQPGPERLSEELFRDSGWWIGIHRVRPGRVPNNPTFEAVGLILKELAGEVESELPNEHPHRA